MDITWTDNGKNTGYSCGVCGATVDSDKRAKHTEWHEQMAEAVREGQRAYNMTRPIGRGW